MKTSGESSLFLTVLEKKRITDQAAFHFLLHKRLNEKILISLRNKNNNQLKKYINFLLYIYKLFPGHQHSFN